MRDGPGRCALKRIALIQFTLDLTLQRLLRRTGGRLPHTLAGECRRCASCCEAPAIAVGRLVWYLPAMRRLFLGWQRAVNGFVLIGRERRERTFVFRCTHFDPVTRGCDSYDSRPGMCRDYPRALLDQVAPTFFPGCGYRPVDPRAGRLLQVLSAQGLSEERLARLKRGLLLE